MKTRFYFDCVLFFSILVYSQYSLADGRLGAAADDSKWQPYETQDPKSIITIESVELSVPVAIQSSNLPKSSQEVAQKVQIIKVKTPGQSSPEGARMAIKVDPQNRYEISCKIMGEGKVMLCVYRGGWVYGEKKTLSSDWEDFNLEFFTGLSENISPMVLACNEKPLASVLNLRDLSIEKIKVPEMPMLEMEPLRFEADFYPPGGGKLVKATGASGGICTEGKSDYFLAQNIPLPQTSRPFYIYLRVMVNNNSMKSINLVMNRKSCCEVIGSAAIPSVGKWVWVRTGPLSYKIGKSFSVSAGRGDRDAVARLDSLIISTRNDLSETGLDRVNRTY